MNTQNAPAPRRAPARVDPAAQGEWFFSMYQRWMKNYAEEFRGISTDGHPRTDLFPIAPTGCTTEPICLAAEIFLANLSAAERAACTFAIDDKLWRGWSNIHRNLMRHGICLADLDEGRRELVLDVLRAGMSKAGFEQARNVMRLNEHTGELTGKPDQYGEWYYYISIFGTPSATEPWGWQLDGHHCNLNCFVVGDQMVLTPALFGAEPVVAESGIYKGTTVLRAEEDLGWRLMASLSTQMRAKATLGLELPFDGRGSGFSDNVTIPYEGAGYDRMDTEQQKALLDLAALYVGRMPEAHAALKMAEVREHLDEMHFAWIGAFDETSPFYYRIHSPVVWIEYFHQPGIALKGNGFNKMHAHGLIRTPNGNDYGRAWLDLARRRRS